MKVKVQWITFYIVKIGLFFYNKPSDKLLAQLIYSLSTLATEKQFSAEILSLSDGIETDHFEGDARSLQG